MCLKQRLGPIYDCCVRPELGFCGNPLFCFRVLATRQLVGARGEFQS